MHYDREPQTGGLGVVSPLMGFEPGEGFNQTPNQIQTNTLFLMRDENKMEIIILLLSITFGMLSALKSFSILPKILNEPWFERITLFRRISIQILA